MKSLLSWLVVVATIVAQDPKPNPPAAEPAPRPVEAAPPAGAPVTVVPVAPLGSEGATQETPPAAGGAPLPEGIYFAQTSGTRVRVRGGAGDFHSILKELDRGTPVRVLGREGDWCKVEIPGGVAVYVALGGGSKTYLSEAAPGDGLVTVNDLMIRGDASTQFPPLGRLMAGDKVMILDKSDQFARILAPPQVKGFIHGQYLTKATDQAAAGADFLARHRTAEEALLKGGALSAPVVAKVDEAATRRQKAEAAFAQFETEQGKTIDERDTGETRLALEEVRNASAAGDPSRARADAMLAQLDEWEATRAQLKAAKDRLAAAAAQAKAAEDKYKDELSTIKRKREELDEANRRGPARPPYLAQGYIRRSVPVAGELQAGPPFALYQGSTTRKFLLVSDRYDLSQYADKLVGILAAEGPVDQPGVGPKLLKVVKMEILHGE